MDERVVRPVIEFLAWLLLAAAAAAGSWFAIDYAGRQVGGSAAPPDVVLPSPVGASPTPTASLAVTPSASTSPSPSPSPSGEERGTTSADGGRLVVRCAGTALTYWAVRPTPGWQASTSQKSVSEVEVVFTRPGGRSVVRATCRATGPDFT